MFSWSRTQLSSYGLLTGTRLIGRVLWSRAKVNLANKFMSSRLRCPCCGWTGRRFYDYIEVGYSVRNAACPQCDSHPRHRAFYIWLQDSYPLREREGRALVFAPEKALAPLWEQARQLKRVNVDISAARGVDLLANAENLPLASDSMDLIWCHHVLEHVEHDRVAIGELCRVLRPGVGELIVSVPMEPGTRTDEYGFADPHQSGHWRMYGDDFADRLAETGLTVEPHLHDLSPPLRRQYGTVPERFYVCRKNGSAA